MNRRKFLEATAATAAATIVPRHVLGGTGFVAPSDKLNISYIGCGSQGLRLLIQALPHPELKITSVVDPNRRSDDYPTWGPGEIKGKIRNFLNDPGWGEGLRDGTCGREVGRELVNKHYAKSTASGTYNDCRAYADFREMLAQEEDLDAVYIMTPEHLHAYIAIMAMREGKHAIMHKTMANTQYEAKLLRDLTVESGLATHMWSSPGGTPAAKMVREGVVGPVREVLHWTNRPFWPQGMFEWPEEEPIPDGFDWDLWLGPVPDMPYSHHLTHAVFRGWFDFGSGSLGDVGNYSLVNVFEALGLGAPSSVQAFPTRAYLVTDTWHRQDNNISFPRASILKWEFPARGNMPSLTLTWMDGGLRPDKPDLLEELGVEIGEGGLLYVGDEGIVSGAWRPSVYPESKMPDISNHPEPVYELDQFIQACKGGPKTSANFEKLYDQITMTNISAIAMRFEGKKLLWDHEKQEFTNEPEANKLLKRKYRPGWEI